MYKNPRMKSDNDLISASLAMGKPQIVDRYVKRIIDTEEIYSGVYARVFINFYAFNF